MDAATEIELVSSLITHLTTNDVLSIHEDLIEEFSSSGDPIRPPGIRSSHLLESAVARQTVGFGARLKYDTAHSAAATLAYGLCMNHPFFNGNKRTSLVSLLCHLDRNDWTFVETVGQGDLYDLMLRIARHGLQVEGLEADRADGEVAEIARWVRKRTRRIERGERVVTFRELKAILESFGLIFEDLRNNTVDLLRERDKSLWFGLKKIRKRERIMRMPFPGGGQVAGKGLLKEIRERCDLDEMHGCDSTSFYGMRRPTDYFFTRYRKTLARLARV